MLSNITARYVRVEKCARTFFNRRYESLPISSDSLSSRSPTNSACGRTSPRVHSVNFTSATSAGRAQTQSFNPPLHLLIWYTDNDTHQNTHSARKTPDFTAPAHLHTCEEPPARELLKVQSSKFNVRCSISISLHFKRGATALGRPPCRTLNPAALSVLPEESRMFPAPILRSPCRTSQL
jgi:hypothetical protein